MSAPVSAWATKPGAWALDAEEHEDELNQQRKAMEESKAASSSVVEAEFPTLKAAVATKGKKKNKKGQTLSLAEFTSYSAAKLSQSHEDLMDLPTGPRERSAEEMVRSRIGGGFRSCGIGRSEGDGDRWGGSRGFDEGNRSRGVSREPLGRSKADEVDDWGAGKRSLVSGGGFERRSGGGGGFFGSDSKADEVDSWVSKKSFAPSERRIFSSNGGADSDTWGRKREERFVNGSENGSGGSGRPKLNLKPRSVPLSTERPQSPDVLMVKQERSDVVVMKKSFNPFGEARPREEVLAEKGQDWKKIDEQFESLKIKERPGSGDSRPGSADRPGSGKRGFGSLRGNAGEDKTERSWRKPDSIEGSRPTRAGNPTEKTAENGNKEEK